MSTLSSLKWSGWKKARTRALLRSPLRFLVGDDYLLVHCLKRGAQVERLPVGYLQEEGQVLLFAPRTAAWWRELAGTTVTLMLQGSFVPGLVTVEKDTAQVRAGLVRYIAAKGSHKAHIAGVRGRVNGSVPPPLIDHAAEQVALVRITVS